MEILERESSHWPRLWNSHRIQLLTVDLHTLFVYWEIDSLHKEILCMHFQQDWSLLPLLLQLYDVTISGDGYKLTLPIERIQIRKDDDHRYFRNLTPNHEYVIDLGTITSSCNFFTILRSQSTRTPSWQDHPERSLLSPDQQQLTHRSDFKTDSDTKNLSSSPLSFVPYSDEFDGYSLVNRRDL